MTPRRTDRRKRHPIRRLAATAVVGLLDPGSAFGQNPEVIATYQGLDGRANFAFKLKDQSHTRPVGLLNWVIPDDQFSTAGLPRTFPAFCAEPLVGVTAGNTYRFDLQNPEDPAAYGLPNTEAGQKEAKLRGVYIRELFGRYYLTSVNATTPDAARAFQVALWEIAFETQLPADLDPAAAKFNLFNGTFQADYPNPGQAPTFVSTAQTYLTGLTGNDTLFYGPGLAGYELVRLNGLPNAAGVVAQDQYALRMALGGAGLGPAGTTAGGLAGGIGGLGGGIGGGGGGFGGIGFGGVAPALAGIGAGGGSGSSSPPTTTTSSSPPTSPPTTTTGGSPPTSPPTTTIPPTSPPPGPPPGPPPPPIHNIPPTNPVPGPSGVILGGIAAMALAGRRGLKRVFGPKS
jgi:hypothetical protein